MPNEPAWLAAAFESISLPATETVETSWFSSQARPTDLFETTRLSLQYFFVCGLVCLGATGAFMMPKKLAIPLSVVQVAMVPMLIVHLVAFAIGQAFASLIPFGRSTTSAEYNPLLRMPPSFLVAALLAAVPIAYAPLSGLVRVLRKVTDRRGQPDAVAMHDERVLRPAAAAAAATTALAPAAADGETPSGSATASTLRTVRGVPLKALRLLGVSEEDIRNR